jgi:hypothetical protein
MVTLRYKLNMMSRKMAHYFISFQQHNLMYAKLPDPLSRVQRLKGVAYETSSRSHHDVYIYVLLQMTSDSRNVSV